MYIPCKRYSLDSIENLMTRFTCVCVCVCVLFFNIITASVYSWSPVGFLSCTRQTVVADYYPLALCTDDYFRTPWSRDLCGIYSDDPCTFDSAVPCRPCNNCHCTRRRCGDGLATWKTVDSWSCCPRERCRYAAVGERCCRSRRQGLAAAGDACCCGDSLAVSCDRNWNFTMFILFY